MLGYNITSTEGALRRPLITIHPIQLQHVLLKIAPEGKMTLEILGQPLMN